MSKQFDCPIDGFAEGGQRQLEKALLNWERQKYWKQMQDKMFNAAKHK